MPYVFWLEHLVHLHSVLLLKDIDLVIVLSVGFMFVVMSLVLCGPLQHSTHRVPLRISCKDGLVVMNSLNFCLVKSFISPSILNDRLAG